jgi:hypothetical protein
MGSIALRVGKVIWIYDYALFFRLFDILTP